jgi:hypothetical protein
MLRPRRVLRRWTVAQAAVAPGGRPDETQTPEDPFEQVKQLGELREQGILTEDEFTAEKRRVLGL